MGATVEENGDDMSSPELEILIPAYNRPSVRDSIDSVLDQLSDPDVARRVSLHVCDDAGDKYNIMEGAAKTLPSSVSLRISRNPSNLGMSGNLRSMLTSSTSEYVLILTDDDLLEPGAIQLCLDLLSRFQGTAAFLFPRHGWDDNGTLRVVDCVVSKRRQKWIGGNALDSVRYARHGFILSGLLFRRSAISLDVWDKAAENAYFPVLLLGNILASERVLFLNRRVVRHRVFNETFWHRWGNDEITINKRLYSDFACAHVEMHKFAIRSASMAVKAKSNFFLWWSLTRARLSWTILMNSPSPPPAIQCSGKAVMRTFRLTEKLIVRFHKTILALYRLRALSSRFRNFGSHQGSS